MARRKLTTGEIYCFAGLGGVLLAIAFSFFVNFVSAITTPGTPLYTIDGKPVIDPVTLQQATQPPIAPVNTSTMPCVGIIGALVAITAAGIYRTSKPQMQSLKTRRSPNDVDDRLQRLLDLYEDGKITQAEYDRKREEILDEL